jgi:hypothetical protein
MKESEHYKSKSNGVNYYPQLSHSRKGYDLFSISFEEGAGTCHNTGHHAGDNNYQPQDPSAQKVRGETNE